MREQRLPESLLTRSWVVDAPRLAAILLVLLTVLVSAIPVSAEITLPPGFTIQTYLTGHGFDSSPERGARGIPSMVAIAFDPSGALYLNRIGARFRQGEAEDFGQIYRFPGKATMTKVTEKNFLYGPPLLNPRVSGGVAPGEVFVTTYDRDRKLGALYRLKDGRASLFAGGTPPPGGSPLFKNPEGVALDSSGNIYVADREQGVVIKLDPAGGLLNPRFATGLGRVGPLAIDTRNNSLWVGSDGTAQTPFQDGLGQIWRVSPDGSSALVLQGPLPAGFSVSPGGALFVAPRRTGRIFVLSPDGREINFINSTDEITVRTLAFAPTTLDTTKAGFGGSLFVVISPRMNFAVSEVVRIFGPFDEFVQRQVDR